MNADELRAAHACQACGELYRTRREADLCRELPADEPCGPGGFCLFEAGRVVRTDDGCPTHSKRPRLA